MRVYILTERFFLLFFFLSLISIFFPLVDTPQRDEESGDENTQIEKDSEFDFVEFSHGTYTHILLSLMFFSILEIVLFIQCVRVLNCVFVTHTGEGQAIVVCAWLNIKEVSLLLATIVKKIPLFESVLDLKGVEKEKLTILTESQIENIGNKMLDTLLQIRHKGAIEKAAMGLQAVCEVLFSSKNPKLHNLPVNWLNLLYDHINANNTYNSRYVIFFYSFAHFICVCVRMCVCVKQIGESDKNFK